MFRRFCSVFERVSKFRSTRRNFGLNVFVSIIAIVSIILVYLNLTALNFVVAELQCSRRADTGLRSKPLAYSKPLVYTCGFRIAETIAELVFDDREMLMWDGSQGNPYDILVLSGLCNCVSNFRGKVLYVDGEPGSMGRGRNSNPSIGYNPRTYYIGIKTPPRHVAGHRWVTYLAMVIAERNSRGEDYLSTLRRETRIVNTKDRFLCYCQSYKVPFRENAYDRLVSLARENGWSDPVAICKLYGSHPETIHEEIDRRLSLIDEYKRCKFVLSMENSNVPGYVTEKILLPLVAGSIPIYYGTKDIYEIFDESCFVYYDIKSPASALARIQSLQASDKDYKRAVSSSCLHEEGNRSSTVERFFSLGGGNGLRKGSLRKSIRRMMGYDKDDGI